MSDSPSKPKIVCLLSLPTAISQRTRNPCIAAEPARPAAIPRPVFQSRRINLTLNLAGNARIHRRTSGAPDSFLAFAEQLGGKTPEARARMWARRRNRQLMRSTRQRFPQNPSIPGRVNPLPSASTARLRLIVSSALDRGRQPFEHQFVPPFQSFDLDRTLALVLRNINRAV